MLHSTNQLQLIFVPSVKTKDDIPHNCIDDLITCTLPSNNEPLKQKIKRFMTHKADHLTRENSQCNKNGRCIYGYPQPLCEHTWIDEESGRVIYKCLTEEE